jgi:hypothetical protein
MLLLILLGILFTWLLLAAVCVGMGSLLLRLATFQRPSLVECFWSGIAAIVAVLQLYHFFRPIDAVIVALLCLLALSGLFLAFRRSNPPAGAPSFPAPSERVGSVEVLLFFLAAAVIAFRSAAPTEHYDTGLYGAQAVRWFTTYPLVPGLGNLLAQLGFNSSIFLCIAALNHGPWSGLAHHFFVGFLLAAFFASIIPAALRIFRGHDDAAAASRANSVSAAALRGHNDSPGALRAGRSDSISTVAAAASPAGNVSSGAAAATEINCVSATDWFLTFLFLPAAIWAATGKLSGANTDLPTTLVSLAAVFFLFRALDSQTRESTRENNDGNVSSSLPLIIAMLLFSLAITFKLSSLVFALTGWMVSFLVLCFSGAVSASRRKRLALAAVILSVAIVVPWICRGLVLTGYPLFPSTALGIPAEWKVPPAAAEVQADFARSFARIPQIPLADTSGYRWLGPWSRELVREREGFLIPVFFMLAGVALLAGNSRRKERAQLPRWLWLLVPAFAGILFWFFEAPAIRFGEPVLWTAAATLGSFAALQFLDSRSKRYFFLLALLLATAWAAHPRLLWNSYFRPGIHVRTFLPLPQPKVVPHQAVSGLTIYVPVETNQCWDAALPCSLYFDETLRLRRANELESGFVSNGPVANGKVR